jgi:hypothetical protein
MRVRGFAVAASILAGAGLVGIQGGSADANADLGPGCRADAPAVAHRSGLPLASQPEGAPVPCAVYTGFPGGESRIEVANDGAVIFSPAPYLRGIAALGYGPDDQPNGQQWMFNDGGVAVTHDLGAHWSLSLPLGGSWTMDDASSYYDRDAGRYFWVALTASPIPQTQRGAPSLVDQIPLGSSKILSTDDAGESWQLGSACCPISDRAPLIAARAPAGQAPPINGYPNVLYFCHEFGTGSGTCSKSLDGGLNWTFVGFDHRAGLPAHTECAMNAEGTGRSGFDSIAPMPDGSLLNIVTCGGVSYLAQSNDEAATWPVVRQLPHAGDLRADRSGNLYLMQLDANRSHLLLSVSGDEGQTWSPEVDVTAPGVTHIHDNWFYAVSEPGELTITYNAQTNGQSTYDGYITTTRDALNATPDGPVFWSAQANDPNIPLMYGDALQGVGYAVVTNPVDGQTTRTPPPQVNQLGAAIGPDGTRWASFTEDCGANPDVQRCRDQHNQTRGFAARLVWP